MSVTLIMGASGSGKSTAIRTLPEDKTLVISISKGTGKSLPFKGWKTKYSKEKGNFIIKSSATELIALLTTLKNKAPKKFKYIVVDDVQYIMAFDFLRRAKEAGFAKFTELAQAMVEVYDLLASFEDVHCFMLQHTEDIIIDGMKNTKAKTLGKLIDDKITWEGLFTIVLQTEVLTKEEGREYTFKTQNNGDSTAKSPAGMFDTVNIPNDLLLVANAIEQYDN